jgi:hypothetical protein
MWLFAAIAVGLLGGVAGITAGKLLDKTAESVSTIGGLFPKGTLDPLPDVDDPENPGKKKVQWGKIIVIGVLSSIGILIVKWVGKKLKIKLLK